jgi:diguanylate cyclase (GGDEF)-like protein
MLKDTKLGSAQTSKTILEQLEKKIVEADSIEEQIDAMNGLAWRLRIQDPKRALVLSSEALKLSRSIGYESAIPTSLINLAFLDAEAGNLDVSLSQSLDALAHLKDRLQPETLIGAWYTMGWTYYYSGSYPSALEFGLKALKMAREFDYREQEAWCLDLVASTYTDGIEALQMYQDSLAIFEGLDHLEGQSRILNNWACTLIDSKEFPAALDLAQKSLHIAQAAGLKRDEINVITTIGEIYAGMGNYSDAQEKFTEALLLFDQYGHDIGEIYVLIDLGQVYLELNELDHAEQELSKALELASKVEMRNEQARCHQYLSQVFERRDNFEKALEHYKKFQALRESIAGEGALKEIASLRVSQQIETARRDAEIHRLQKEKLQDELDEHKRIHAILEELATRDPLTNLFNRRHFMSLAEREWNRATRYHHPLCALMLDVDRFKEINDEHGHAVGDRALTAFANVIRSTLRSTEIAGRYGGDEFVILLPETEAQNGLLVANRICEAIIDYTINSDEGSIVLTPSIGVACATMENHETTKSLNELLNHADRALYTAKKLGKGQVCLYMEQD